MISVVVTIVSLLEGFTWLHGITVYFDFIPTLKRIIDGLNSIHFILCKSTVAALHVCHRILWLIMLRGTQAVLCVPRDQWRLSLCTRDKTRQDLTLLYNLLSPLYALFLLLPSGSFGYRFTTPGKYHYSSGYIGKSQTMLLAGVVKVEPREDQSSKVSVHVKDIKARLVPGGKSIDVDKLCLDYLSNVLASWYLCQSEMNEIKKFIVKT